MAGVKEKMKKRIVFPCTFRGHLARQKLLLDELSRDFEVKIFEPTTSPDTMSIFAIFCAVEFNNYLSRNKADAVLIRGDRYEMLGLAMVAVYRGLKVIHIEGGDLSGAVDNKVRHAITDLADYHFATNAEAHSRIITMGVSPDKVWNYGSLDVEFAESVVPKRLIEESYILAAYHPIVGEDKQEVEKALAEFTDFKLVNIISNKDYGEQFGKDQYDAEDYINLIRFARCCVGNSSSFLKEASILGVPVVNIGARQEKRLKPKNVLDVPCEADKISLAIDFQLKNKHEPDNIYYQPETSKKIANKLKEIL